MARDIHEERGRLPIFSLLSGNQITPTQKAFVWVAIILTGCAVGIFIWMIAKASAIHSSRGIVLASSLILFAIGLLYFLLARINNPRRAWIFLYITIPVAVAAAVVSLYLDNGVEVTAQEYNQAEQILILNDPSDTE